MPASNLPTGGVPHTNYLAVGTSATKLTRSAFAYLQRNGLTLQQADTVDVFLGGPDVVASGLHRGYQLCGTPVTSPATPPVEYSESVGDQDWYGIVASGTGHICVVEVY